MIREGKKWNLKTGCPYLVLQYPKLLCGLYLGASEAEAREMEGITGMGVGTGCSSTLFNRDRERVISLLRLSSRSPENSYGAP